MLGSSAAENPGTAGTNRKEAHVKNPPILVLAAMALSLGACAERHTETQPPVQRPPTAAEVPPAQIPPEMPPPSPARPVEDPPETVVQIDPEPPPGTPPPQPIAAPRAHSAGEQAIETIETDSGLIIEILRRGEGPAVRGSDSVVVHYHGTLADGRVFDSTYERDQPQALYIVQTIRGWQEGIPGMQVGEKRRLIVPPELGYGRSGTRNIPPNSLLIFEIELLEIVR